MVERLDFVSTIYRQAKGLGTVCLLAALLVSCSSDDDNGMPADDEPLTDPDNDDRPGLAIEGLNGTPADQLTSPWLANMSFFRLDSKTPGTGDAYIDLIPYRDDFPVSNHIDYYTPELDTCEIYDLTDTGGNGEEPVSYAISGGQSVTFNTASGLWYELPENATLPGVYDTNNGLPGAFPADLTLSIPGDAFPAVQAYPLREPEAPLRILPAGDYLSTDDVTAPFTWVPGAQLPGSYIDLAALLFNANDEFIGFPVVCTVIDDGSFTLPQEVVEAFANGEEGDQVSVRFQRVLNRVDIIDGVVFHQRTTVSE